MAPAGVHVDDLSRKAVDETHAAERAEEGANPQNNLIDVKKHVILAKTNRLRPARLDLASGLWEKSECCYWCLGNNE